MEKSQGFHFVFCKLICSPVYSCRRRRTRGIGEIDNGDHPTTADPTHATMLIDLMLLFCAAAAPCSAAQSFTYQQLLPNRINGRTVRMVNAVTINLSRTTRRFSFGVRRAFYRFDRNSRRTGVIFVRRHPP